MILYVDLHGHSRKKNVFMYGNSSVNPFDAAQSRLYPYILSKLCDFFSFESCRFSMHKSKEATARIAMYRELKIPAIFTLEASFSGADMGQNKDIHFTTEHLMTMGRKVLEALLVYQKVNVQQTLIDAAKPQVTKKKGGKADTENKKEEEAVPAVEPTTMTQDQAYQELDQGYLQLNSDAILQELTDNKQLIKMTEGKEEGDGDSSGSESDPSEDNLEEEEMAKIVPISAKKAKPGDKKKSIPEVKTAKKYVLYRYYILCREDKQPPKKPEVK